MSEPSTPEAMFDAGYRLLPRWQEKGDDLPEREARALDLITRAAEAGHFPAMEALADGLAGPLAFDWALRVARAGEAGPLVSALTSGDWPVERCREVLTAAELGEPWALVAVGLVYTMGMADYTTKVLLATQPNAWGWLPAAADPDAAGMALIRRAAAGWAPAALSLALKERIGAPARALEQVRIALRDLDALPPDRRKRAVSLEAELLDATDAPIADRLVSYERLAAGGDTDALVWLGDRHRLGEGVPADPVRARELYEPAAAAGSVDACRELGKMLEAGLGGPADDTRARELYERAAELGADPFARDRLAEKYGLTWYARKKRKKPARKPSVP